MRPASEGPAPNGPHETVWLRENALAMERRHLAEGEARCEQQRLLIERLRDGGHDTIEAEGLLLTFLDIVRFSRDRVLHLSDTANLD